MMRATPHVPLGQTVTLNDVEVRLCAEIAKARYESNRAKNVVNARIGPQSNEATDLEGVAAEVAFCKLFNLYPAQSFVIEPRSSSRHEDSGDATLHTGHTVDVKATTYPNGRLVACRWKNDPLVDCYALMIGACPSYSFRGFMTRAELIRAPRMGSLGHGPTYIAVQSELVDLPTLLTRPMPLGEARPEPIRKPFPAIL